MCWTSPAGCAVIGDVFDVAAGLLERAKSESKSVAERLDAVELDELKISLGAGGTGKGAATAARGTVGLVRELERRQRSRATRIERDVIDRALVDLSGFYRDVIALALGAPAALVNPDRRAESAAAAEQFGAAGALARLDAVLACREAIEQNVKLQIALEAMIMKLFTG